MDAPSSDSSLELLQSKYMSLSSFSAAKPPSGGRSTIQRKNRPRRALADLTNDSPISGLAPAIATIGNGTCIYESTTPCSKLVFSSDRSSSPVTPGDGEDILRSQVKFLLGNVETDSAKIPLQSSSKDLFSNAAGMISIFPRPLDATPANTPLWSISSSVSSKSRLSKSSCAKERESSLRVELMIQPSPAVDDIKPVLETVKEQPDLIGKKSEEDCSAVNVIKFGPVVNSYDQVERLISERPITRSLLFDSPDKPVAALTHKSEKKAEQELCKLSMQVMWEDSPKFNISANESTTKVTFEADSTAKAKMMYTLKEDLEEDFSASEEEEEGLEEDDEEGEEDEEENCEDYEWPGTETGSCEDLCWGMKRIVMTEENEDEEARKGLPAFEGTHIRFKYNSNDEIEVEEEVEQGKISDEDVQETRLKLNGLPTPKGKHTRFVNEEEDDS